MELKTIVLVEDQNSSGNGSSILGRLQEAAKDSIRFKLIDCRLLQNYLELFSPSIIVLDLDAFDNISALRVALEIRTSRPNQLMIFMSEHSPTALIRDGMQAAVINHSYWLEKPSRSSDNVLQEILQAYHEMKPKKNVTPPQTAKADTEFSKLSPQQHRVMRLLAIGYSNAYIASECRISVKAAERTISSASKLLEVTPASKETNHRVNAALKYLFTVNPSPEVN
ncbi:MAG: hypothetical protein RIS75_608 [Actinomycetota bacterium]|jgi:DNA-binding NarL/FixJ family response regulator